MKFVLENNGSIERVKEIVNDIDSVLWKSRIKRNMNYVIKDRELEAFKDIKKYLYLEEDQDV